MKIKDSVGDKFFSVINYFFLSILLFLIAYPLIYTLSASISDPLAVSSGEMWLWPVDFTSAGYRLVFSNSEIWTGYRNTILYATVGALYSLALTMPCAFALSRKDLIGRSVIMKILMFTMYFSGGLIPSYFLMKDMGLINNPLVLILPTGASVMHIIISRTYFSTNIPGELVEAAEIDGCSPVRTFMSIVLPLSKAIIAIIVLYVVVGHWNSYFSAMIYLDTREYFPLQLFLREILVEQQMNLQMMMEGTGADDSSILEQVKIASMVKYSTMIVASVPLLIAYPFLQRYFVKGVMIGSIKG